MKVNCEVDHCKFSTPRMGRDAYPAMVAHLQVWMVAFHKITSKIPYTQVHSAVKHGLPIGEAINPLGTCSCGANQNQVDDGGRGRSQTDGHRQGRTHLGLAQVIF